MVSMILKMIIVRVENKILSMDWVRKFLMWLWFLMWCIKLFVSLLLKNFMGSCISLERKFEMSDMLMCVLMWSSI